MPLRILELRSADGDGGGPEKTILRGAKLSDPLLFEIHVVYLTSVSESKGEIHRTAENLGIPLVEFSSRGKFDFSQLRKLRDYVKENDIQIVHSHEYKSNFLASRLRKAFPKLKLLSTVHGWTGNSWKERFVYYPIDKRVLNSFPKLISVSSEITSELVNKGVDGSRIMTVPNAIEPDKFVRDEGLRCNFRQQNNLDDETIAIGAVGRLEKQKRFDLLIDAFNAIVKKSGGKRIQLLIAGDGSLKSVLKEQIGRLGLESHVELMGHVSDIRSFFSGVDIFVQSSDYEGTSNAVLEAMAMEVPIVATLAGGTADILKHEEHGLLVPIGDVPGLQKSIEILVQDFGEAKRFAKSARKRVEVELSFKRRNHTLENIYLALVNKVN